MAATTYTIGARIAAPAAPGAGRLGHAGRRVVQGAPTWRPRRLLLRGAECGLSPAPGWVPRRLLQAGRRCGASPVPGRGVVSYATRARLAGVTGEAGAGFVRYATPARAAGLRGHLGAGAVRYATPGRAAGLSAKIGAGVVKYGARLAGPAVGSVLPAAGALHLGFVGVRLDSLPAVRGSGALGLVAAFGLPAVGGPWVAPIVAARAGDEVLALPAVWQAMTWPAGGYIGGALAALAVLRGEPVAVVDGLATVAGRVLVDAGGQAVAAADADAVYGLLQEDYQDLTAIAGGLTVPDGDGRAQWLDWLRLRAAADIAGRSRAVKGAALDRVPALAADMRWLEVRA